MAAITEAAGVAIEFAKAMRMRVVDDGGAFCGVPGLVAVDEGGALRFIETELAIDLIEIKEFHGQPMLRYIEGAHAA